MHSSVIITLDLSIMPHRNIVSIQFHRIVQKSLEFDFFIAHDVRIGRSAVTIFIQKIREDTVPVLFFKVDRIIRDADLVSNLGNVLIIFSHRTNAAVFFLVPVFHEDTDDVIALLFEQICANRRVNAAAHSDNDTNPAVICHN